LGLREIHKLGIIHTDLKPENIAIVLEEEESLKKGSIGSFLDLKHRNSLFIFEVVLLTLIFNIIFRQEVFFGFMKEVFDHEKFLLDFLRQTTKKKLLLKLLKPPYRSRIWQKCKKYFLF
jgi:serine/threonine protein kinase